VFPGDPTHEQLLTGRLIGHRSSGMSLPILDRWILWDSGRQYSPVCLKISTYKGLPHR
jgi:hypothetical protein